jgi:hypothetical protein
VIRGHTVPPELFCSFFLLPPILIPYQHNCQPTEEYQIAIMDGIGDCGIHRYNLLVSIVL